MPLVAPIWILLAAVVLTAGAGVMAAGRRWRARRALTRLGEREGFVYRPEAERELARRVAPHLPAVGAATVLLRDLLVADRPDGHHLVLRADYTLGSVRRRRDEMRILSFHQDGSARPRDLRLAPPDPPRIEQYRRLLQDAPDSKSQI